jgi:hypothetical protein
MTQERIEVVLRVARQGGTKKDVQEALGETKDAARILVEKCVRENLVVLKTAGCRQPYRLSPVQSEPKEVDWWDKEPEEQKKPVGKNWFEGWAGASCLGLSKG